MYFWGHYNFHTTVLKADPDFPPLRFPCRVPLPPDWSAEESLLETRIFDSTKVAESNAAISAKEQVGSAGISSAACGLRHCVAICRGDLFGFGLNDCNQLGDKVPQYLLQFRRLGFRGRTPPVQVACGKKHTLVRTSDGLVYSSGDNTFGQLGLQAGGSLKGFVELRIGGVVHVAASENSSFALTAEGALYSWGYQGSGHLAHGSKGEIVNPDTSKEFRQIINVATPQLVRWFQDKRVKLVEISAGKEHMITRSDTDVYTCGEGSFGRLGNRDIDVCLWPVRVEFPSRKTRESLVQVVAGDHHSIVLKVSGEVGSVVYVFGKYGNNEGQLHPIVVEELPNTVHRVFAGTGTGLGAVTSDGCLLIWGDFGSTGVSRMLPPKSSKTTPNEVTALSDFFVEQVVCGATFGIILTNDSKNIRCSEDVKVIDDEEHVEPVGGEDNAAKYHRLFDTMIKHAWRDFSNPVCTSIYDHEAATQAFWARWLGSVEGAKYYEGSLKPPPLVVVKEHFTNKRGAHALTIGSKVRLWMTNIYALGTVATPLHTFSSQSAREMSLSQTASSQKLTAPDDESSHGVKVTIEWARDDWQPEELELFSDDETIDEENENRWQPLWFTGPPTQLK